MEGCLGLDCTETSIFGGISSNFHIAAYFSQIIVIFGWRLLALVDLREKRVLTEVRPKKLSNWTPQN